MIHNTREYLAVAAKRLAHQSSPPEKQQKRQLTFWKQKKTSLLILTISFIFICSGVALLHHVDKKQPVYEAVVPSSISKQVPFPIYYPDPAKLPRGYILDKASFSTNGQVIVYGVTYDTDKKIAFTLQAKPSTDNLATFYKNQLQMRTETQVPFGTLALGTLNNQKFLSLPVKTGTWLIATAPSDADPKILLEIIKDLKQ